MIRHRHRRRASVAAILVTFLMLAGRSPVTSAAQQRPAPAAARDTAVFAGGCFWGMEGVFEHVVGVVGVTSGYTGGSVAAPSYAQVGSGATGDAEAVQVVYDPAKIGYAQLLQVFFLVAHDPTQYNRQGPDVGPQYRSAVFYGSKGQQQAALDYIAELTRAKTYPRPIVTAVVPRTAFYPAEAYHQNYMARHPTAPYIVINDRPKLERLRQRFPAWYQEQRAP